MGDLFSPLHLVIVLLVALLVFGPRRLPEIGRGLGRSIQEFRSAMNGVGSETATAATPQGASLPPAGSAVSYQATAQTDPVEIVDVPASAVRHDPS